MVHILARIAVKPEAADAARAVLTTLVTQSRLEPGCISYQLYQQAAAPHLFQTVEDWTDQAAVDAHMSSPHIATAIAAATPMFTAPPEIVAHTQLM